MKNEKSLEVKKEIVHVVNPITGKEADVVIDRDGFTDNKLAMVLLAPDSTKEQKDSYLSNWLWTKGKENASFITELFLSKGKLFKETQGFKKQMRWDFESLANTVSILFADMADDVERGIIADESSISILKDLGQRLRQGSEIITKERERITTDRMREKGYGVYLDKEGKAYSIFDSDIEEVVKKDKEELKDNK